MIQKVFLAAVFMMLLCLITDAQEPMSNLPTLYIETQNSETIRRDYIGGTVKVVTPTGQYGTGDLSMKIRGRGNSTWNFEKKPYRIKLDEEEHLLGMKANNRDWVLLANHADKSLMRNAVAFKIGQWMDLEFTPEFRFVDVVLNGEFMGNYMVTDQIEAANNRVPVEKTNETVTSLPELSGGYLLELDGFAEREAVWFTTDKGLKVSLKYPDDDDVNSQQLDYIQDFLQEFEDRLFSADFKSEDNGYRSMADITTLVDWYIASELTGNPDCFWSTYIYKKRDIDKLYWGPLWDYDIAFNNDRRLGDAVNKLMLTDAHNPKAWINQLWSDDWFKAQVTYRWRELVAGGIVDSIVQYIGETAVLLEESQQLNFDRWNILNHRVYIEPFLFPTFSQHVAFLKEYVTERVTFLNHAMAITPTEPFVAENFYYTISNFETRLRIDANKTDRSLLELWEPISDSTDQQWKVIHHDDGTYSFRNRQTQLAMTVHGQGNSLAAFEYDSLSGFQKWTIEPVGTMGTYGLINPQTGLVAGNTSDADWNGAAVLALANQVEQSNYQQWFLTKADTIVEQPNQSRKLAQMAFNVYPNPVATNLHLQLPEHAVDMKYRIYDLTGKIRKQSVLTGRRIDVSALKTGVYILEISNNDFSWHTRIMKQ